MSRRSLASSLATALLGAAITICSASVADAASLTYDFFLNTPEGAPMTDIVLYAKGDGQEDIDISSVTLPGSGHLQLTQETTFDPIAAFVLGLSYAGPSTRTGLPRYHLMMFANNDFAADVLARGERLDQVFDVANEGVPVSFLQAVHADAGDTYNLGLLTDFIHSTESTEAYFDPDGTFRIIAWSIPVAADAVPEPSTLLMLGTGALGVIAERRRRKRT